MIPLGLVGLVLAYLFLWSGIKGTDPRDEILTALRGGTAPKKLVTATSASSVVPESVVNNDFSGGTGGAWASSQTTAKALADIGLAYGLHIVSEKRDRKLTDTGSVSDHWTGKTNAYAYDISGSVEDMNKAAVAIMHSLGYDYRVGSQLVHSSNHGGYRINVLYWTMVGGNHYTHIHIGAMKV